MSTNNENKRTFMDIVEDACNTTKEDVNEARKKGDKFATEFVANLKTTEPLDKALANGASLMGQMFAGGMTLLMCPVKVASKELAAK